MSSSHTQTCYLSPQGCPFPAPLPPTPASLQHHQEGVEWNQVETFHVETLQGLRPVFALAAKPAEKTAKKPSKTPHDDLRRSPPKKNWKTKKIMSMKCCVYTIGGWGYPWVIKRGNGKFSAFVVDVPIHSSILGISPGQVWLPDFPQPRSEHVCESPPFFFNPRVIKTNWCVLRREWMGCWGLLGWLLIVSQWIIPSFPAFSTSKIIMVHMGHDQNMGYDHPTIIANQWCYDHAPIQVFNPACDHGTYVYICIQHMLRLEMEIDRALFSPFSDTPM